MTVSRVDPHEVALGERRILEAGRERDGAVGGPHAVVDGPGHDLEDRVDLVVGGPQPSQLAEERAGDLGPPGPGYAAGSGHLHGLFVDDLGVFDARHFVVGLAQAGRPEHSGGVDQLGPGEHARPGHRPGDGVDGDPPAGQRPHRVVDRPSELRDGVVELRPQRGAGHGLERVDGTGRRRVGVQVGRTVRRHDRDRAEVVHVARVDGIGHVPRRVGDMGGVEQHREVDILTLHLGLDPVEPGSAHAGEVGDRQVHGGVHPASMHQI